MKRIIRFIFGKLLYRVKYINADILNSVDKCLICPNHSNIFDPTFVYPVTSNLYIMAKKEIFKNKLIAKLLKHYNTFPVDRTKVDSNSLRYAMQVFDKHEKVQLLMFPEGKVIKDESEVGTKARKGAIYIAATKQIPIIPVYITRRPKYFSKVKVVFGEPIEVKGKVLENKEQILKESKELITKIYELSKRH